MHKQSTDSTTPTGPAVFHPIGHIENSFEAREKSGPCEGFPSRIVLQDSFTDGLQGLEPDQEIIVIFWFHHSTGYQLRQHPKGDTTRQKRGVFSLRSPHRPSPIGITRVRITALEGDVICVTGLDAFDGTPVLDLKPVGRGN